MWSSLWEDQCGGVACARPRGGIGTGVSRPLSFFLIKEMEKKYLHGLKWGSIPRYPSHIVMKATMCWIPLGFKCYSSI